MFRKVFKRSIFQERRVYNLEQEANQHKTDLTKQRQFLKQLLATKNYQKLFTRYETQPQLPPTSLKYTQEMRQNDISHLQQDKDSMDIYIKALIEDNKTNKIQEKLKSIMQFNQYQPQPVQEGIPHFLKTDLEQWKNEFEKRNLPQIQTNQSRPIPVIISEAWSWSKVARTFGSRIFYGILIMTGLSVVMEQQGIIKSGMAGSEVQPLNSATTVTFEDVQGVDEAKEELQEVVEFLKRPDKFMELGGKLPKGVLLYGPPGTGKTHLARAVAGEAGVPFFQMSGSEFDELYVGVGAKRVRELFAAAKKRSPCIVFIDELDAVGSKRSMKDQSYMRQTLNQLLVEMDGFNSTSGVILIAATNTPESLDKALTRPGRFDKLVPVPLPDVKGRTQILNVHMRGVSFGNDVNSEVIARGTPGFSGADLANLVNQAAIKASKDQLKAVSMENLEWAKDKIIMGAEKKSAVITPESKKMTAYHEGGHTIVAMLTKGAMPLHKVTVIPRGNALGVTVMLPDGDQPSITREELIASIDVAMGGRVAEEIIYGKMNVSTGASNDLQQATKTAKGMVLSYGMSEKVGLASWSQEDFNESSPDTKHIIENEIRLILDTSYERVMKLLKSKEKELHKLAEALCDKETLAYHEVLEIVEQKK